MRVYKKWGLILLVNIFSFSNLNCQILDEDTRLAQKNNFISYSFGFGSLSPLLNKTFIRPNASNIMLEKFSLALNSNSLAFEHLIYDRVGLGIEFSGMEKRIMFQHTTDYENNNLINGDMYYYSYVVNSIYGCIRGSYHFLDEEEDLDVYGFLGLGYNYVTYRVDSNDPLASSVIIKPQPFIVKPGIGLRYFIINRLAINAEFSLGSPIASIGLAYNFRLKKRY